MTELRKRMIECLQLRGLSARTQEMYVRAVRQLAEHYHQSPDVITAEALRPYVLSIKHVKQYSRSASTMAWCGIKGFFEYPLHRDWTTLSLVRAPREKKLPVILSLEEVRKMLGRVRLLSYRVCLATISSCGLRLQEGTPLQVRALDSSRLLIHVRQGKGGKDRDVPRPQRRLALLRPYWVTHRHLVLIFPAPGRGGISRSTATTPMPRSSVQGAFREALKDSGRHTHASVHTLRHAWATHRLEAGVNRRRMQASRGHSSPTPTRVSTHLTARAEPLGAEGINRLMGALGWSRSLRCSAAMAPSTARHLATGGFPVICVPCRTLSGAAPSRSAARSITVRPAESLMTATTLVRTGTVPRASRTTPSRGWTTTSVCCCRCLTSW